jgi:transaldolase/glucose-6-phosphate isomerase
MSENPLFRLRELGVSVWCDELSREMIRGGRMKRLMDEKAVVGVTSNPSIFQKAMSEGDAYDADIERLASAGKSKQEIFEALAIEDIRQACDLFRPVYDATGGGDGYVSIEVSPTLADDTDGTVGEATRFHEEIDRPNLLVKIPATPAGLPAIERMIGIGRSINITLIFSLERYAAVAEAYLKGLEKLAAEGKDLSPVASVASFFVSRVDSEADKRIDAKIAQTTDPAVRRELEGLKGKTAVANAKLAFRKYREIFSGPRWEKLAARGARVQRCLWASTSTKNKAYSDILYVEELVGGPTVNTMPIETMEAYQDHGKPCETLTEGVEEADRVFAALARHGIDYSDITDHVLEREGVAKFAEAFEKLLGLLEKKRQAAAVGSGR